MLNNQFGVYVAYGYANVTSTAIWTAPQTSTPAGAFLAVQADRNIVVYTSTPSALWFSGTFIVNHSALHCLQILDNGNLIWKNSGGTIIWQV